MKKKPTTTPASPPMRPSSSSSSSPPSRVTRAAAARAVDALLKWMRAATSDNLNELIILVLTLKKIPHRGRTNAFRIPLPHSPNSVCLILDDRPASPLTPSAARSLALPVSTLLSLSDLRSDYQTSDARRRLAASHDLFLADRRILPLLPRLLGSRFFHTKNAPVPLNLSRTSWPDQLQQCCASTLLHLCSGTCSGIKVARASQSREEIVDNVMAAIEGVVGNVPRKWTNVRAFHIKAVDSLALPVYQALPEQGLKIGGGVQKKEEELQEEDEEGIVKTVKKRKSKDNEAKGIKRTKVSQESEC